MWNLSSAAPALNTQGIEAELDFDDVVTGTH